MEEQEKSPTTEVTTELNERAVQDVKKEIAKEKSIDKLRREYMENVKEQKALKRFDKDKWKDCKNGFLIQNKRTNRIVEIRAPTVMIAMSAVGWRPRHTKLLKEIDYSIENKNTFESASSGEEHRHTENCNHKENS